MNDERVILNAKIVTFNLLGGATAFLGFALYQMFSGSAAGLDPKDPWMMIGVTLVVWVSSMGGAQVLGKIAEPKLLKENAAEQYLQFHIVRMALHEGAAMVGIVGLLMFGRSNPLPAHPETALFVVPYLFLVASGLSNFPSMDRFREQVRLAKENESMRRKTT